MRDRTTGGEIGITEYDGSPPSIEREMLICQPRVNDHDSVIRIGAHVNRQRGAGG